MKKFVCALALLIVTTNAGRAQSYDEPVRNLSDDEIRLVQAYRRDPEPFRHLLREREEHWEMQRHHAQRELGPRDVIDVTIEGGSIAFFGHNYAYDPVSFRISRGQQIEVVFRRQRSSFETPVIVAYRSDGLHFDVPEQQAGTESPERGYWVIGEDQRWNKGEGIEWNEKINGHRSRSHADHLVFRIRYALER